MVKAKFNLKLEEIEKEVYNSDASLIEGVVSSVIFPKNVDELLNIVRISQTDVVARGGGSGLAGGCVPQNSIIIDMSKMNKIIKIDKEKRTVEVEAGILLDELNDELRKYNLEFPVNPSSHAIATIGGMIATNAVGSRAIKYGRTSDWVASVEIINGKGERKELRKLDLMDVSGMEGITAIVLKAVLKLAPTKVRTADFVEAENMEEVMLAVDRMKRESDVSMIEFFDRETSKLLGFPDKYHLIIEYESNKGMISGGEYEKLMQTRDKSYPVLADKGYVVIEDPKLLFGKIPEFISWLEENHIPTFGHSGVGILHPCFKQGEEAKIDEMMKIAKRFKGEITGEHGIGLKKKQYLEGQDKKLKEILKNRYDPAKKLNRGKVVD